MTIAVQNVAYFVREAPLRIPFDFGNVTATERPLVFCRVTASIDGVTATGVSAETMAPKWFIKGATYDDALDRMIDAVEMAGEHARETDAAPSVFRYWSGLYDAQRQWGERTGCPPLLWGFGVSLVERALVDAFCRARETTFAEAVRSNAFGIVLGDVHPELGDREPASFLPSEPTRSIAIRHTVGHTDPLTDADVTPGERVDDGLPQTLSEYVSSQDLSHFKVKFHGDVDADVARLRAVATVIDPRRRDVVVTIDANEQYADVARLERVWERLTADPDLSWVTDRLVGFEQPLPRDAAFGDETCRALRDREAGPPVIIDESDGTVDSVRRALSCGYAGTSHKNCKGVIRGVANACLIAHRSREGSDQVRITGEDLLNVGPVALLQDLAVVASLGLTHVERNGHHYFRGLSMFPDAVQEATLDTHDDLYRRHEDRFPTLDVRDGRIALDSVVEAPFGFDLSFDPAMFEPLSAWKRTR